MDEPDTVEVGWDGVERKGGWVIACMSRNN